METSKRKDRTQKSKGEQEEEAICSNELLAAIREQMARRRNGPKGNRPKELKIAEPE